jgi:hypothetical protein
MEGLAWQSVRRYMGNVQCAMWLVKGKSTTAQKASRATDTNWQKRAHGNKTTKATKNKDKATK